MTTNNHNVDNQDGNEQEVGSFEISIPKKIPIAILFALIVQIIGGIWAMSGFYYSQKETQSQFAESTTRLTQQIGELKSTIYTRNEALLQFEAIRQENVRQDAEIREIRDKIYGRDR